MISTTAARRLLPPLAGLGLFLLIWSALAAIYPAILLPSPLEVLQALIRLAVEGALWQALRFTLFRLSAAFCLGALLGIAFGLLGGRNRFLAALLQPGMSLAAGVPPIAWIALALIWFGTGNLAPILVALLVAMPVVFVATLEGVRSLDRDLLEMVRVYGLCGPSLLREFYLPALAPHLLAGLTVAATLTVRIGIMGEFLAADTGVGSAMALARTQLNTPEVIAWVMVALGLLFGAEGLLLRPLARRATAWRREA